MIARCRCESCGQELEVQAEQNGERVTCPSCSSETTLTLGPRPATSAKAQSGIPARRPFRKEHLVLAALALVAVVSFGLVYVYGPGLKESDGMAVAGFSGVIIVGVFSVLSVILVIFWILFPWIIWRMLRRIERQLQGTNALLKAIHDSLDRR